MRTTTSAMTFLGSIYDIWCIYIYIYYVYLLYIISIDINTYQLFLMAIQIPEKILTIFSADNTS